MVYAMFSIGILGCLVWSIKTMALLFSDKKVIKLHYMRKKKKIKLCFCPAPYLVQIGAQVKKKICIIYITIY